MNGQPLLRELGRRLRDARARLGLSLAEVAARAAVSRRYLTDAEAGRANPSVLLLARLAAALGTPLAGLLDLPVRPGGVERVALVGLRGAGKSTVGRRLALALEAPFVELDAEVERAAGLTLPQLFDLHGPDGFHRFEAEALEAVLASGDRLVLAAGGSIVDAPDTYARLLATCRTVWLRAAPEQHYARVAAQGDRRPMQDRPRAMDELRMILARREPEYARCERHVDTDPHDADQVTADLLAWHQSARGTNLR